MTEARTVDGVLRHWAHRFPGKDAVVDPDTRLSYADLDASTRCIAATLMALGVNKGSRVGVLAPNGVPWVQVALALTRIGAVLVPLSTLLRTGELIVQLNTAAVQFVIATSEFRTRRYLDDVKRIAPNEVPLLRAVWPIEAVLADSANPELGNVVDGLTARVRPADPLAVIFTSGSRGAPKGVLHSHGNAFAAVRAGLRARCVSESTRLYLPMPFFWVGGFSGGVITALAAGATLVTEPISAPETTLPLLERESVTLFRGWPDQAAALASRAEAVGADLSGLQPGSLDALLPESLRGRPGARANLFGMTESFGPYCGYPADTDMPESSWGSCGKPFEGMDIRVVDQESGVVLGDGGVGEIQLRGAHLMRGICGRPDHEVFTVDGYYPTGDLGRLDGAGFLFYHGRADDMFKVSGATVYPSEVEAALRAVPGVLAAFVTNVPGPQGQSVAALVITDLGRPELQAEAKGRLSAFKVPTRWQLSAREEAVPRGATGKVDVARLRELLTPAPSVDL